MIRAQASIRLPPLDPEPVRGRQEMLHQKVSLRLPWLKSLVLLLLLFLLKMFHTLIAWPPFTCFCSSRRMFLGDPIPSDRGISIR